MEKFTINLSDSNISDKKITIPLQELDKDIKVEEAKILLSKVDTGENLEKTDCRVDFETLGSGKNESWTNVDTIDLNNSEISIDISDEIQQALNLDAEKIILQLQSDASLNFLKVNKVDVIFSYLSDYQDEEKIQYFSLGKAGELKFDVFNKKLNLSTLVCVSDCNVLPFSVYANYSESEIKEMQEIGMPKNWTISIQQFLKKKEDNGKFKFVYIDENGKNQTLQERYYYLSDDNVKNFIPREKLSVNLDGELVYCEQTDDSWVEHKIEKLLKAPSGLKFASSIKDIKGQEYVDHEPEEMAQVRSQLKALESNKEKYQKSLNSLKKQIYIACLNKEIGVLDNIERQKNIYKQNENAGKDPATKIEKPSNYLKEIYLNKLTPDKAKAIIKKHLNNLHIFSDEELTTYYNELLSSANKDANIDDKIDDSNSEKDEKKQNLVLSDINIYGSKTTIENYIDQFNQQSEDLGEIEKQIEKFKNQLFHLEMQVPVHYLYNDNTIYGFSKANDAEDLFRLVLISDAYENAIYINYKNFDCQEIENIIDSNENVINFEYKNGKLASITDSRDRKISFNQNENFQIVHADGNKSVFGFDGNKLSFVLDQSGKGVKIDYEADDITINSLSLVDSVCDGKIEYKNKKDFDELANSDLSDCVLEDEKIVIHNDNLLSTTISTKTKCKTFIFEKSGKIRTIYEYENKKDDQLKANVTAFNYQNKVTQKVTPLAYSENYLKDVCFDEQSFQTFPEIYLGQTFCKALQFQHFYQTHKSYHTNSAGVYSVNMSEKMLNAINFGEELCAHKTFILAGWARANSAFVEDAVACEEQEKPARRFEISATITDENDKKYHFARSFDYRNTDWQYLALPIMLPKGNISSMTCRVDYTGNTGEIQYTDLELKQANLEEVTYDIQNRPIKIVNAHSHFVKELAYTADGNLLSSETITNTKTNEKFVTDYAYSSTGKLLKKIDHNGIVEENVYDKKGSLVKTLTYHKDELTSAFCQEKALDEKGKESITLNSLGEKISKKEFDDRTGMTKTEIDSQGTKTAFAYDCSDRLIEKSTSIDGVENTNTFTYAQDFLTSLSHNGFAVDYDYDNRGRVTKIEIGGKNYLTKTYAENEETITLANGKTFRTKLNKNGKPTHMYFDDELFAENIYDLNGNLVMTTDSQTGETIKFARDQFGQLVEENSTQHGENVNVAHQYDVNHQNLECSVISIGDEDFAYCYDYGTTPDAKLKMITLPNNVEQKISYDKLGRVSSVTTDKLSKNFNYLKSGDHTTNLVSKLALGANGKTTDNLTYKYDEKGNIIEIRNNNDLVARYRYDGLSRLVREDNKPLNKTTTIAYDGGGNILSKQEFEFTLIENVESLNGISENYSYSQTGWKDLLLEFDGQRIEYDEIGNPITYRNKTLTWSHGRRLDRFDDVEFKYNVNGIRTSKIVNGKETKYFLSGTKILAQSDGTNTMYFYYGADGVTGFTFNNEDYYYKKNAQNDVIGIYKTDGKEIVRYFYDGFGRILCQYLSNVGTYVDIEDEMEYINTNETNSFIATLNPIRYRSYYYDKETKLYYLNSRYYDPEVCRFINVDDVSVLNQGMTVINGLNLFAYCNNNPVNLTDENGYAWWDWLWKTVVAVVAVVVVTAAVALTAGAIAGALGATVALASSITTGAAIGGATVGSLSIIGGIINSGGDARLFDIGGVMIDTFAGAAFGALTAVSMGIGTLTAKIAGGVGKVAISGIATAMHAANNGLPADVTDKSILKSMVATAFMQTIFFGGELFLPSLSNSSLAGNILNKIFINKNDAFILLTSLTKGIYNILFGNK